MPKKPKKVLTDAEKEERKRLAAERRKVRYIERKRAELEKLQVSYEKIINHITWDDIWRHISAKDYRGEFATLTKAKFIGIIFEEIVKTIEICEALAKSEQARLENDKKAI